MKKYWFTQIIQNLSGQKDQLIIYITEENCIP